VDAEQSSSPTTRLRDLSEAEVLGAIFPILSVTGEVLVGPGDDAAVVETTGSVIATTDSMVRDRDWRDDWSTGHDVGVKLVAQNVADVAAMGGVCTGLLVSLMADPALEMAWLLDFAHGVADAARDAGAPVIGGDLSSAPAGVVVVSITALGDLQGREPVLRSGAQVGDVVAVCGSLGWSGAGLATYAAGLAQPADSREPSARDGDKDQGPATSLSVLRRFHRSPRPPWESGPVAAEAGATAMLDLSDGLVRDGGRIAKASGVTLDLDGAAVREHFLRPPLTDVLDDEQAWREVLSGGEEHSLLATFPAGGVPVDASAPWVVIGRCVPAGPDGPTVSVDGIRPVVSGWDHFHP
jgi:thiamine-monophosphate kinase